MAGDMHYIPHFEAAGGEVIAKHPAPNHINHLLTKLTGTVSIYIM